MAVAIKRCKPFLQRAEELAPHEPVIAYYFRVHALDILGKAHENGEKSPELQSLLIQELDQAEKAKRSLDLSSGREKMEQFALGMFKKVDEADRAGSTDANTASQFYIAGLFLDACAQFHGGEMPPDLQSMSKYAKFRAVQIRDCVKQGIQPTPPPAVSSSSCSDAFEANGSGEPSAATSAVPAPSAPPLAAYQASPSVPAMTPPALAVPRAGYPQGVPQQATNPFLQKGNAREQLEFSIAALDEYDVETARQHLFKALSLLEGRLK
mmetsp:Transcript_7014/g.12998  ORF Transcript_7014/g.12998 Transcript_7014/m.12998 type:complete len:267 (+) Transcript_7014:56-856(+)